MLREAADSGNPRAQISLALALIEGRLVSKDETEAMSWLISLGTGSLPRDDEVLVRDLRAKLSARLSPEEIALAKEIAARRHEASTQAILTSFLYPSGVVSDRLFLDGCAADESRADCGSAARVLAAGGPRCLRDVPLPDKAPTSLGPLARTTRIPDRLMRSVDSGQTLTVVYVAHVDRSGYVCRVGLRRSSGVAEVDAGVLDAVATWRFQPAMKDAEPVESLHRAAVSLAKP